MDTFWFVILAIIMGAVAIPVISLIVLALSWFADSIIGFFLIAFVVFLAGIACYVVGGIILDITGMLDIPEALK